MNDNGPRRHAAGGPGAVAPDIPEPTFAERVRTLMHVARVGSLATLSRKHASFPFGSVMPFALDEVGRPLFLISSMAVHTQNLLANPRGSLLVTQPDWHGDPLAGARVTLLGNIATIKEDERAESRTLYLARHANAKSWIDFDDFSFFRMDVLDAYFVGGFGMMGWVAASDYRQAAPDPLADSASRIISHMNGDHADALKLLASVHVSPDVDEAMMTAVDRLGFQVRLKTGNRVHGARIPFSHEARSADEARTILVEMVAKARQNG